MFLFSFFQKPYHLLLNIAHATTHTLSGQYFCNFAGELYLYVPSYGKNLRKFYQLFQGVWIHIKRGIRQD